MINLVKNTYLTLNVSDVKYSQKKDYTTRTIDIRSTVKDFSTSKGNHIISKSDNKASSLVRNF